MSMILCRQMVGAVYKLLPEDDVLHVRKILETVHPTARGSVGAGLMDDGLNEIKRVMKIVEKEMREEGNPVGPLVRLTDYYFNGWQSVDNEVRFDEPEVRKCIAGCLNNMGRTVGFMVAGKYHVFTELQLRFDSSSGHGHAKHADDNVIRTTNVTGIEYAFGPSKPKPIGVGDGVDDEDGFVDPSGSFRIGGETGNAAKYIYKMLSDKGPYDLVELKRWVMHQLDISQEVFREAFKLSGAVIRKRDGRTICDLPKAEDGYDEEWD